MRLLTACWLLGAVANPVASAAERGDYVETYGRLLERHTQSVDAKVGTRVDYRGLKNDPDWPVMLAQLGAVDPGALTGRKARLAFFINAYNVLAIDTVLRSYPVDGIKDAGSIFRSVWKREAGRIGGRGYTLDEIEHEILRPMGEPRIHAAIVCASVSCPNLLREPYVADRLDEQLDASVRAWLARPEKGLRVDRQDDSVVLSPIFDWFEEDFGGRAGVLSFVARYASPEDGDWLRARGEDLDVSYFDYDWGLNE
jgi:hypothetical protein